MALENAQYIPELVETNPAGSDPVSQGDDHLRATKLAIKNSLSGFVGTQANPKSVTLTEDQINDAALKSAANTFTQEQTFSNSMRLTGGHFVMMQDRSLRGVTAVGEERRLAYLRSSDDVMIFGEPQGTTAQVNAYAGSLWTTIIGGAESVRHVPRGDGSLHIADSSGVFGNVAAVHKAQTFTAEQTLTAGANFGDSATFENTKAVQFKTTDTTPRAILQLAADDRAYLGDNNVQLVMRGRDAVRFDFNSASVAQLTTRANGSLLVYDRSGNTKKVGFRNPTNEDTTGNTPTALQDWEGQIRRLTGTAPVLTLPSLEKDTTIRFLFVNAGSVSNASMEWFSGGSVQTGNRTIAAGSVIEISYRTSTVPVIFGNGIS